MQNDAGEYVDMYIPRKWLVIAALSDCYQWQSRQRHNGHAPSPHSKEPYANFLT